MSHNPYAAPAADLLDVDPAPVPATEPLFYIVAKTKFWLVMVGTLGMYSVYWFYRNWRQLNRRDKCYWPIPRAIFAVFFTHSLFGQIEATRVARRVDFRWRPGLMATVYVVCALSDQVSSRLAKMGLISDTAAMAPLVLLLPMAWSLATAQAAINAVENDPDGRTNARITLANIAWIVAVWLLVLLVAVLAYQSGV